MKSDTHTSNGQFFEFMWHVAATQPLTIRELDS